MKKLLFLLTLTAAVSCNTPQELAVMTLNMRYDNPEDGMNNWRFRRERIAGLIRSEAVDLLGTGRGGGSSTRFFSAATVSNCSTPGCSG